MADSSDRPTADTKALTESTATDAIFKADIDTAGKDKDAAGSKLWLLRATLSSFTRNAIG